MNTGNNPETALLIRKPEFKEKVVEIRNNNENTTWDQVREQINKEFTSNISLSAIKKVYNEQMAISVTISGPAQKHFSEFAKGMTNRLSKITTITDVLADEMESLINMIKDNKEVDAFKKGEALLKIIPYADKLTNSFMKQLQFITSQLDQVKIEQKKMIWDETKVHDKVQECFPAMLKLLEDENKIAIIDRTLLDN